MTSFSYYEVLYEIRVVNSNVQKVNFCQAKGCTPRVLTFLDVTKTLLFI
jgi:hypothetical protein